tara:strand:+ start:341 stop:841 length:501 start_codon:yes stop_codon:yes gene_type:complete
MSKIIIPEELYTSIKTVIKYQNILLLKEIAKDNGWKYIDLKKKYLKTNDIQELVNYSNKQKKKIKIKKNAKKKSLENKKATEVSKSTEATEATVATKAISEENITLTINSEEDKDIEDIEEIECHKYTYMDKEYYVNIKNNNVYNMDSEFIGRMVNEILNFDEEEI